MKHNNRQTNQSKAIKQIKSIQIKLTYTNSFNNILILFSFESIIESWRNRREKEEMSNSDEKKCHTTGEPVRGIHFRIVNLNCLVLTWDLTESEWLVQVAVPYLTDFHVLHCNIISHNITVVLCFIPSG